jgi:hypothetical protein
MFATTISTKIIRVSGLCLMALAALGQSRACQAAITFNSTYRSAGGDLITAIVEIDGNSGSYNSFDQFGNPVGSGQLFNVNYGNLGGKPTLSGDWKWISGSQGRFFWAFDPSYLSFQGNWTGPGSGFWSGSYDSGSGQLGANGPLVGNGP